MKPEKKSWFEKHWAFFLVLGISILVIGLGYLYISLQEKIVEKAEKLPQNYDEAKQNATKVSYENLLRYSESYDNQWVCFEGKVVQLVSDKPNLEIRVSTKEDDFWEDYIENVLYVYSNPYSGERILNEDFLKFCGKSKGLITYESISSGPITIPLIETSGSYVLRIG